MIRVEELSRRFGDVTALDRVSFSVGEGELFGFLGPNGAGKTTAIRIMTGLSRADSGRVRIAGIDLSRNPRAALHLIGVVPDESNLYPELTGLDNLLFCASLYGMDRSSAARRAVELLEAFDLSGAAGRRFAGYSKGMKRKLTIAAALIHRPPILFLDEPTTGIDVASAREIRGMLLGLRGEGTTILLTTHYIEEAERLCDRIAFIVGGRIVLEDTVAQLLDPLADRLETVVTLSRALSREEHGDLEARLPGLTLGTGSGADLRVGSAGTIALGPLVARLAEMGVEVLEARRRRLSLEDVFVRVTEIDPAAMRRDREKAGARQ